jgi:tetratricopeptide (TPR) repeat protein
VIRCFSLSSSEIVILSKFNNAKEIFEYFFSRFDSYKWFNKNINCKECSFFKNKTCQGGCLAFNGNVIDEYKNKSIMAEYSSKRAYDYCKNENLNLAVKSFKESLTYCFDNKIMCDYIYLLLKLGNIKEAIINFSKFENEIFQNNAFWLIKGFIEEVQGNYDVAIGNYRRALKNIKKEHKPFVKEKIKALS